MASTGDITAYGGYEAAHEVRWDEDQVRDIRTLHVATDTSLLENVGGRDLLTCWVKGASVRSSHFQGTQQIPGYSPGSIRFAAALVIQDVRLLA
jgi:hypothetical protein